MGWILKLKRRKFFKWLGLATLGTGAGAGGWFVFSKPENEYYSGPESDHFNGTNFFNPGGVPPGKFTDLIKWQLSGGKEKWPSHWPSKLDGAKPETRIKGGRLNVTMVGHATLLIQTQGLNFLTDPVWAERASPVSFAGPKRVNPPGIRFEDLPPIDFVLLSHNHYDHMDINTLGRLIEEHKAKIICPLGNDTIIKKRHPQAQFITGDWGDAVELAKSVKLHFEPCHHWSARGTRDRRMALWAAFVIETPNGKIYHIGDTGYHNGINYRALHEKHGPLRLAILPIGAYEPRWFMKGQHQNPDEAAQGHLACHAKTSIGHHWGTFQLTNEAIDAPLKALEEARKKHNIREDAFVTLKPGENHTVS